MPNQTFAPNKQSLILTSGFNASGVSGKLSPTFGLGCGARLSAFQCRQHYPLWEPIVLWVLSLPSARRGKEGIYAGSSDTTKASQEEEEPGAEEPGLQAWLIPRLSFVMNPWGLALDPYMPPKDI
eukprot:1139955-Pelagomonas_calceolata.AAC.9